MAELPAGWVEARLDSVSNVRLGRQRSPKNHSGDRMRPYLRAANVTWAGLDLTDVKQMNFTEAESKTYELQAGDVLLSEASGSASEVGKPAVWRGRIEGCCFQNTLVRVRAHEVDPGYLFHFFRSEALRGHFGDSSRGVGIHHIGVQKLAAWGVPLPPLAEQRRIVSAIEEQFSRLDAAEQLIRMALPKIRPLIASAVATALGSTWPLRPLADVVTTSSGGTPSRKRGDFFGGQIPWVKSGELRDGLIRSTEEHITEPGLRESSAKVFPEGTLLIALYGATVGRLGVLGLDAATNQAVCAIRPKTSAVSRDFLMLILRHKRSELTAAAQGGAQPNISQSILGQIEIPLPPLADQRRIVAEVEAQLSRIDAMRAAIARAQRRSAALRRSILERAFRGELVPQDPCDEPAGVLLERIAAART